MKNKDFIPYEQALALKELGFDEPCYKYVYLGDTGINVDHYLEVEPSKAKNYNEDNLCISQPTYSAAFRWFRDKHGLYHHIVPEFYTKGINFNWQILWYLPKEEWTKYVIYDGTGLYGDNGEYPSQESAEQECLEKLIEIIKNK